LITRGLKSFIIYSTYIALPFDAVLSGKLAPTTLSLLRLRELHNLHHVHTCIL